MITLTLKPRDTGKYVDMIEVVDMHGRPCAIVHIDTFWPGAGKKSDIYNALNNKEIVTVKLSIDTVDLIRGPVEKGIE